MDAAHGVGKEITNNYVCVTEVCTPEISVLEFCTTFPEWLEDF